MDLTNIGGFNTMINNLMANLIKDIRESGVPIGIVYYMLKDILVNIEREYNDTLEAEAQNIRLSQEEQQNNSTSDEEEN